MHQLDLDFSKSPEIAPKKMEVVVPVLLGDVGKKVHTITNKKKEKYDFSEDIEINGRKYSFVVSSKIKEGAYTYDAAKDRITSITIRLVGSGREYRFTVGFSDYTISRSEQERYHDDSLGGHLEKIFIGYIMKLDAEKGGARYRNKEGQVIENFDYFKYLFSDTSVHHILMPLIKKVVLDIENGRSSTGEK